MRLKELAVIIFLLSSQALLAEDAVSEQPQALTEISLEDIKLFGVSAGVLVVYSDDVDDNSVAYTKLLIPIESDRQAFLKAMDIFNPYIIHIEQLLRKQGAADKADHFKLAFLQGSNAYTQIVKQNSQNMTLDVVKKLSSLGEDALEGAQAFVSLYGHLYEKSRYLEMNPVDGCIPQENED